jgi:hypothetical protein
VISSRFANSSTFYYRCKMSDIFPFYLKDDVNVYRSSPPLPGIFRPSHLVPNTHAQPLPDFEDSLEVEGFSSDDETDNAEAGEAAGDDGSEHSTSPNEDTQAGHPKGTRSVARKRRSSTQATSSRLVSSWLQSSTGVSICFP